MALNALGITFIFDVDNYMFNLIKGSGSSNQEELSVSIVEPLANSLNTVKIM